MFGWLKPFIFGYQYQDSALEAHSAEQRPCKAKAVGANPSQGSKLLGSIPFEKFKMISDLNAGKLTRAQYMALITNIAPYDLPLVSKHPRNHSQIFTTDTGAR